MTEFCHSDTGHTSDSEQISATRTLGIPLTQERVLPPGHWLYPLRWTELFLQATGHTPEAVQRSATRTLDTSKLVHSASRPLDRPLTYDRILSPGQWTIMSSATRTLTEFYLPATEHVPDEGQSSVIRTLDIPLTQYRFLPPRHWTPLK
ncbi:hypothetical protein TNCV_1531201 [Trichonephila clavipes]|nr:hypothetical protein TNCV_1531201 [Trichonephila clavipes]